MANENTPPAVTTPPAAVTPPAAAPAAVATPAAAAPAATPGAPAVAPARAAAPPAGKKKQDNRPAPFDKDPAFRKRLDQHGARIQRKLLDQLGVASVEEAAALAAAARATPGAPAAVAPVAAARPTRDTGKAERELAEANARIERQKLKIRKLKASRKDAIVESEIRIDAVSAGIISDHVDFAMGLYLKAVTATPDSPPPPATFFSGLRTARPYLFTSATPPAILNPTTAPPASLRPGEETPVAPPVASPAPAVDVDKMDDRQFAEHKRRNHGFSGY